jgi:predicted DNA-binding protein
MIRMKKTKLFPSTIKYRENNPAVSFRLKKEDKEKLDGIVKATGKGLSQWMTDFIHDRMDPNGEMSQLANNSETSKNWALKLEAQKKELEAKLKESDNEEKFRIPCSICGKPMLFSSRQSSWKTDIYPKLIEKLGKRYHTKCKLSKSPSPALHVK